MNFHEGEIMKMQQQRVPSEINPVVKMEILMPAEPPKSTKERYRKMKRKFKLLVYENECYQEELRNLQRKLLKLSRDKNFLLDRLMQYEKVEDSSDDSDVEVDETTDVSDSEELPQSQQTSKKSHAAKTTKKQRLNSEASSESGQNQSTPKPPRDTKRKPKKTKAELAAEQALASSPMKVVQVSVERLTSTRSQDASVSGFTGISLPLNRSPQKSSSTQPSDGVERWKVPVGLPESSQSVAVLSGLEPESPCIGGPPMNSQNNGGGD